VIVKLRILYFASDPGLSPRLNPHVFAFSPRNLAAREA
jgi:hypothetical protein